MPQKDKSHIISGVIIAAVVIALNLYAIITHQLENPTLAITPFIVIVVGLAISGVRFSQRNQGNVTFGNIFAYCFRIVALVTVVYFFWTILSMKVIFPRQIDDMLASNKLAMERQGITPEEIKRRIEFGRKNGLNIRLGANILMSAIVGAIGSLIAAAAAKKNPNYKEAR